MQSLFTKGGPMKVLVMEDVDGVFGVIDEWLSAAGHTVRRVRNSDGLFALPNIEIVTFDAVLLDCHQDGQFTLPATLPWVVANVGARTRIVVMSGAGGHQTAQLVSKHRVGFLGKPISRDRLLNVIAPSPIPWPRV